MYLQKVIRQKNLKKYLFFVGILKAADKKSRILILITLYESKDPDPFQNVTDRVELRWILSPFIFPLCNYFCVVISNTVHHAGAAAGGETQVGHGGNVQAPGQLHLYPVLGIRIWIILPGPVRYQFQSHFIFFMKIRLKHSKL